MGYSILKFGRPVLSDIEELEEAKKQASLFVTPTQSDFIEIRDSANEAVTIGYYDGVRFHWTEGKIQTEAWKSCTFVTEPPLGSKDPKK
jgi:hypothetical protein